MLITRPGLNLANMAKQLSTTVPVNPTGHSLTPGRNHPAFIQPRGPTHGQQEAAPAAFWFAAGASVWTEGQTPALPLPAPACVPTAIARPTAERSVATQPHRPCPTERSAPLNLRRVGQRSGKGVGADRTAVPPPVLSTSSRPHTAPSLAPPARLRSPPASPPAPEPLSAGLQTVCVVC